ncbi:MAG: response regulator transcription factor [Sporocytophaga sp.]|nr:response regulator transcription factor [Sporocytophaga sp.]
MEMVVKSKTKIIIADAQPVFREGIKKILEGDGESGFLIEEVGNTDEFDYTALQFRPDILIIDYNSQFFELNEIKRILSVLNDCRVIVFAGLDKKGDIIKSLDLNVYCYLMKDCGKRDILKAVTSTIQGEKFFCPFIVDVIIADRHRVESNIDFTATALTIREKEIVKQISIGKTNKEIGDTLNISPHTVHTHRKNIMKKLQLHSAVELCNYAIQSGIVAQA